MRRHLSGIRFIASVTLLALACAEVVADSSGGCAVLLPADAAAIRAVIEAYRASWLRGDEGGALETFTSDATLLRAHGASPVVGIAAGPLGVLVAGRPRLSAARDSSRERNQARTHIVPGLPTGIGPVRG
jgi:hypothetical protein